VFPMLNWGTTLREWGQLLFLHDSIHQGADLMKKFSPWTMITSPAVVVPAVEFTMNTGRLDITTMSQKRMSERDQASSSPVCDVTGVVSYCTLFGNFVSTVRVMEKYGPRQKRCCSDRMFQFRFLNSCSKAILVLLWEVLICNGFVFPNSVCNLVVVQ
jgi:hypothetical protein